MKTRLIIKVPTETLREFVDRASTLYWEKEWAEGGGVEVSPGVFFREMYSMYEDYYGNYAVGVVVQWGDRFFRNDDHFLRSHWEDEIWGGDLFFRHYKDHVRFSEVFPEKVERTVYR